MKKMKLSLIFAAVLALSACPGPNAPVTNNAVPAKKPTATPAKPDPVKPAEPVKPTESAKPAEPVKPADQPNQPPKTEANEPPKGSNDQGPKTDNSSDKKDEKKEDKKEDKKDEKKDEPVVTPPVPPVPPPFTAPAGNSAGNASDSEPQTPPKQDEQTSTPAQEDTNGADQQAQPDQGNTEIPDEPEVKVPKYTLEQGQHYKQLKGLGNVPVPAGEIDLENGNTYFFCQPNDAQKAPVHILASTYKIEQMRAKGELIESLDGSAVLTTRDAKRRTMTSMGCVTVRK